MTDVGDAGVPGLLVRDGWWTGEFCAAVRSAMSRGWASPAEIAVDGYALDSHVRQASDVEVDAPTLSAVERAIAEMFAPLGARYGLRLTRAVGPSFLRYGPGGLYRAHRDRADDPGSPEWERRVSVVVFLNGSATHASHDAFVGGSLRIYPDRGSPGYDIIPRAGALVAFPSETLHEVMPVRSGIRDVVVDWLT